MTLSLPVDCVHCDRRIIIFSRHRFDSNYNFKRTSDVFGVCVFVGAGENFVNY